MPRLCHMWYTVFVHNAAPPSPQRTAGPADRRTQGKRIPAIFYRTDEGGEPIQRWLRRLSPEDRKRIGEDIKTVEFGGPIGTPLSG